LFACCGTDELDALPTREIDAFGESAAICSALRVLAVLLYSDSESVIEFFLLLLLRGKVDIRYAERLISGLCIRLGI